MAGGGFIVVYANANFCFVIKTAVDLSYASF